MPTSHRPARLREAHAHLYMHGQAMDAVPLHDCTSADDMLERLARRASATAGASWIVGVGARPEAWSAPAWPRLERFDEAVGPRPAIAWCFDTHALMASSGALLAAGIGPGTPDPEGGIILRDRDGKPSGLVLESAAKQVAAAMPAPDREVRLAWLRSALADLRGHGFTEVHDLKSPPTLGPDLAALEDAGSLDMDVRLYVPFEDLASRDRRRPRLGPRQLPLAGPRSSPTARSTAAPPGCSVRTSTRSRHPRGTPLVTPERSTRRCASATTWRSARGPRDRRRSGAGRA